MKTRLLFLLQVAAVMASVLAALIAKPADGQLIRRPTLIRPAWPMMQQMQQPVYLQQAPPVCLPGMPCYAPAMAMQPAAQAITQAVETIAAQPIPDGTQLTAEQWFKILVGPGGRTLTADEKRFAFECAGRAGRVYSPDGRGCGTCTFNGRDATGTFFTTNAHVGSTTIGARCRVQVLENGVVRSFEAVVVEAAYSSRTRTDWALTQGPTDVLAGVSPIKLSKQMPDPDAITATWGCPRCEAPRGQIIETVRMGSVWHWQPNSIGGQSGSGVIQEADDVPVQFGLLSWTENGNGSGQFTATMWEQSRDQNTNGPARTGYEIPVSTFNPFGVELKEGFHTSNRETGDLGEYPIWADETTPPDDPTDPTPAATFKVAAVVKDPANFNAVSGVVLVSERPDHEGQLIVTGSALAKVQPPPAPDMPVDIRWGGAIADPDSLSFLESDDDGRELVQKLRKLKPTADWQKIVKILLMVLEIWLNSQQDTSLPIGPVPVAWTDRAFHLVA